MHHLLFLAALASASFEDLEILDERILVLSGHAEQIDKRLKLAQCPDDPVIAPPVGNAIIVRCPALGWRLRVPVKAPELAPAAAEIIIRKGELVECVSGGPGFAVSIPMIALDNAGIGEPVRVKSQSSPIPITATVKARGLVSF
jgi:flagellar basal body P-ring formation protein FlgA